MPALGLSQKSFKVGQNTFKVYGDDLASSNVSNLKTTAANLKWQNWQTLGHSKNHVEIQADLVTTTSGEKPKDTVGDLTVTVTDSGTSQQATTTVTDVKYTP
jgi:hypothetical protein